MNCGKEAVAIRTWPLCDHGLQGRRADGRGGLRIPKIWLCQKNSCLRSPKVAAKSTSQSAYIQSEAGVLEANMKAVPMTAAILVQTCQRFFCVAIRQNAASTTATKPMKNALPFATCWVRRFPISLAFQ